MSYRFFTDALSHVIFLVWYLYLVLPLFIVRLNPITTATANNNSSPLLLRTCPFIAMLNYRCPCARDEGVWGNGVYKWDIPLVLVINQLNAQILFYNKFIICLYMFRALCAHHQGVKSVLYSIWYHHTCRWPSDAPVHWTATYRCDDTRYC